MSLRKLDSEIWKDSWFWGLKPEYKLVMLYLFSACDWGGVWRENRALLEHDLGFTRKRDGELIGCGRALDWDDMMREFNLGETRVLVKEDKWWLVKFAPFHFRSKDGEFFLNRSNGWHSQAIRAIQSAGFMGEFEDFYPGCMGLRVIKTRIPSLEDIKALPEAQGVEEAELKKFCNHYQGYGWKIGQTPIVDVGPWLLKWLERAREIKADRVKLTPQAIAARRADLVRQIEAIQHDHATNFVKDEKKDVLVMKPEPLKRVLALQKELKALPAV